MPKLVTCLGTLAVGIAALGLALSTSCTQPAEDPESKPDRADTREYGPFELMASADSTEIFALHPYEFTASKPDSDRLHGYRILGRTTVDSESSRDLIADVAACVKSAPGDMALCFNPRHGIRCQVGDETIDLVICFECLQIYEYRSSQEGHLHHTTGEDAVDRIQDFYTSRGLKIHKDS